MSVLSDRKGRNRLKWYAYSNNWWEKILHEKELNMLEETIQMQKLIDIVREELLISRRGISRLKECFLEQLMKEKDIRCERGRACIRSDGKVKIDGGYIKWI